jgi:hypothetical protein
LPDWSTDSEISVLEGCVRIFCPYIYLPTPVFKYFGVSPSTVSFQPNVQVRGDGVGKILFGFKHLGMHSKTSQGYMVFIGLQHIGKKSVTTSKAHHDSQVLSRCPGDKSQNNKTSTTHTHSLSAILIQGPDLRK